MQEELPDEEKAFEFIGIVFNRYWLFALFIMVLVPLPFDFASFALAPQSVIVPLSGLTIVCSLILSYYMLGESITRIHVIGTSIILTGVVITSVTGGGNPPQFTVCELIGRYSDPDVLVAATFVASIITVNMYWIWTRRHWKSVERLRVLMYAVVAGSLGSGVNVGFKATGELTKGSVGSTKTNTFATLWPYLHIVGVGILAIGMISTINRGLQQYDAAIFTPLYFTSLIVMSRYDLLALLCFSSCFLCVLLAFFAVLAASNSTTQSFLSTTAPWDSSSTGSTARGRHGSTCSFRWAS